MDEGYGESYKAWEDFPATDETPAGPYPPDQIGTVNTQPFWKQQLLHGGMPGTTYARDIDETYNHSPGPSEWLNETKAKAFGNTPYPNEGLGTIRPNNDAQGVMEPNYNSNIPGQPGAGKLDGGIVDPSFGVPMKPTRQNYFKPAGGMRTEIPWSTDDMIDPGPNLNVMNWNDFPAADQANSVTAATNALGLQALASEAS